VLASPFLPRATTTLWQALGMGDSADTPMTWKHVTEPTAQGRTTRKIAPLFPKPVAS
jgi:methionyl-tRNA synthetase